MATQEITDETLRIIADQARGAEARETGFYFNRDAYTAGLRAVFEAGREAQRKNPE